MLLDDGILTRSHPKRYSVDAIRFVPRHKSGVVVARLPVIDNRDLAVRLSAPRERWGWEFSVPQPVTPSSAVLRRPEWVEYPLPETLRRFAAKSRRGPLVVGVGSVISLWATGMAVAWGLSFWPVVLPAGVLVAAGWYAQTAIRHSAARRAFEADRNRELVKYERALAEWNARVAEHERREQQRVSAAQLWHPVCLGRGSRRVEVFGGGPDGWASLLATLGMSLLASGESVLVIDHTEQGVGVDLATLASQRAFPVRVRQLPADGVGLLDGLSAAQVAELVAEALQGLRSAEPQVRAQGVIAELIELVASRLTAPLTFGRIAAGLRLLRRVYDAETETVLSGNEIRRINDAVDAVGPSESARAELRFLSGLLGLLGGIADLAVEPMLLWPRSGLNLLAIADGHGRRKDLVDRLLFHRVLHDLRCGELGVGGGWLVVAGADHLGLEAIETLARHARRRAVRLVLMVEHLRGELTQLLGGADAATILMHLGSAPEASAAADFVGRGYRFVLSQLTEQIGISFTDGISDSHGDSFTDTHTDGYSGASPNASESSSRALTWSSTTSWSGSESTSTGRTYARGYEYVVEPTTFQSLPPTAFVLVENHGGGRRVVSGDCNPGIALLDRVSAEPRKQLGGPG